MAKREVLGTMTCPECGFTHAEVKAQKCGEKLYRYCPECNAQTFARTAAQEKAMRAAVSPSVTVPAMPVESPTVTVPVTEKPAAPAARKKAAPTVPAKPAAAPPVPGKVTPPPSSLAGAMSFLLGGK